MGMSEVHNLQLNDLCDSYIKNGENVFFSLSWYACMASLPSSNYKYFNTGSLGQGELPNCPTLNLLRGRDGISGRDGRDGISGRDGRDGQAGAMGPQGLRGKKGDRGPTGGPPGPTGPQGATGLRGSTGRQGPPGPTGPHGATGPQGATGLRGSTGRQGPPGPTGPHGATGQQGATGLRGSTGRQGPQGPRSGGVVYTRWGSHSCPSNPGTELVYAGRVGGSQYGDRGGGSNHLCMPPDPDYTLQVQSGVQGRTYVYGSEYEFTIVARNSDNVPCTVCSVSTRLQVLMIPAKTNCPASWTREYYGYLMTEHRKNYRSSFICVDRNQETVTGSQGHTPASDLYHVEAHCSGMACPPYVNYKELTCVVCTK